MSSKLREKTRRTNGTSLQSIITDVNPVLRGWYRYFRHSQLHTFRRVDGWVRMRLRSILRRREKKRGRGRGSNHHKWPNRFFGERGLFSLERAHVSLCQSAPQ